MEPIAQTSVSCAREATRVARVTAKRWQVNWKPLCKTQLWQDSWRVVLSLGLHGRATQVSSTSRHERVPLSTRRACEQGRARPPLKGTVLRHNLFPTLQNLPVVLCKGTGRLQFQAAGVTFQLPREGRRACLSVVCSLLLFSLLSFFRAGFSGVVLEQEVCSSHFGHPRG